MAGRCFDADAIVVLGCRGPAALRRRLAIGIRLFEQGAAALLMLSGGGSGPVPEAELMRRSAIAHGVPPPALLIDILSRDTFENARETARLLSARGLGSVVLVSDRVHLPRAALLFRLAGLRVAGGPRCRRPRSGGRPSQPFARSRRCPGAFCALRHVD